MADERWSTVDDRQSSVQRGSERPSLAIRSVRAQESLGSPRRRWCQSAKSIEQRYHSMFDRDGGGGGAAAGWKKGKMVPPFVCGLPS